MYLLNNNKKEAKKILDKAEKIAATKPYFNSFEYDITELKLKLIEGDNLNNEELALRRKLANLAEIIEKTDGKAALKRINWQVQKSKYESEISKSSLIVQNNKYKTILVLVILGAVIVFLIFLYYSGKQKLKIADTKAQETERKRIAEDLHDNIINKLTVIRLKNILNHDLKEIDSLLNETIEDSRRLSHALLPPMLEDEKIEAILKQIANNWKSHFTISFKSHNPKNISFNFEAKIHLTRIFQELIQNIYKHAQATEVTIKILIHEKHLEFIVIDNGIGFDGNIQYDCY